LSSSVKLSISPDFKDIYLLADEVPVFKTFLSGKWFLGSETFDVKTPIDGSLIARVSKPDWFLVEDSLRMVREVGRWRVRDLPGDKRLEIIFKTADLLESRIEDFTEVLVLNAGKLRSQAKGEVTASIERLRKAPLDLRSIYGDYVPGDWSFQTLESEAVVRREPYGVVLSIIPYNYPLFDTVNKFTYSFVAGNAVLIKPPSADPIVVLMFVKTALDAGVPPESVGVVTLSGKEMSKLVSDPRIDVISFTGSTEVGKEVLRSAGIKQFIMELGGGDPVIVLSDANLEVASQKIVTGITSYAGQRCDAIKIVIVEESVYEDLKNMLVRDLSKVRVGDPRSEESGMGPLIDERSVNEVIEAVNDSLRLGGKILYGGRRLGPTYVEPTLIEITDKKALEKAKLYRDEVFGPIALITSFRDLDEAVRIANGRRYGLDAAIFGHDIVKIRKLVRYLEVGVIYVNEFPRHGIGYYPFGGRKESGIGREGIGYSIEQVTALKTIIYNYKGTGIWHYM